jgi:hypothetical protein
VCLATALARFLLIDSAESEKWIGEWMKARGNRDELVRQPCERVASVADAHAGQSPLIIRLHSIADAAQVIATKFTTMFRPSSSRRQNYSGNHAKSLKVRALDSSSTCCS